jgi:hypothetical protein
MATKLFEMAAQKTVRGVPAPRCKIDDALEDLLEYDSVEQCKRCANTTWPAAA